MSQVFRSSQGHDGEMLPIDRLPASSGEVARSVSSSLNDTPPPCPQPSTDEVQAVVASVIRRAGQAATNALPVLCGYDVLEQIGRGGMGVVYRARQQALKRIVALKVIRGGWLAGPEELARFRREAESAARLQHPHIVQVFEIGEQDGLPFCALELVEGGSLAAKIDRTPQPPTEAARIVLVLARAIYFAHQKGVIHRDLKPANVLLTADGTPKVADFGLAKLLDAALGETRSGEIVGTPSYMAPEQAAGDARKAGPAVDIYALGAMLYELLTGRPPFAATSVLDTLAQVRSMEPYRPRTFQPSVPVDLETICLKCLEKDPARRYASAVLLADDLERFLEGKPITARPVGRRERLLLWARRRPTAAALALALAALAVALLVGMILGVWFNEQLHEAKTRTAIEETERQRVQYHSLESKAAQIILDRKLGWRFHALEAIKEAAGLPTEERNLPRLRSLASDCLAGIDLRRRAILADGINPSALAFSPDGKRLAVGENWGEGSCRVLLCEVPSGQCLDEYLVYSSGPPVSTGVRAMAFSPLEKDGGRWLVAGTRDGRLHTWDTGQKGAPPIPWDAHLQRVTGLAFLPENGHLISVSTDKTLKLWTYGKWQEALAQHQFDREIQHLSLNRNGSLLVCSGRGLQKRLRPASHLVGQLDLVFNPGLSGGIAVLSPSGRTIGYTSDDRLIFEYEQRGPYNVNVELARSVQPAIHDAAITGVQFHPGGSLLVTTATDRLVKLWEVPSSRCLAILLAEVDAGDGLPTFSPDGHYLAVADRRRTILYEVHGLREQTFIACDDLYKVRAFAYAEDGKTLACVGQGPWTGLTTWDTQTGALLNSQFLDPLPQLAGRGRPSIAIHPDGRRVAFTGWDTKGVYFSDIRPAESRRHDSAPLNHSLCFVASGQRLWGVLDHEADDTGPLPQRGRSDSVVVLAPPTFKEVGSWLGAVLAQPAACLVLPPPDFKEVGRWPKEANLANRSKDVTCLAAGTRWVVAGGGDGITRLFAADGAVSPQARFLNEKESPVHSVALSADETLVAAGSRDGSVDVYRGPEGQQVLRHTVHRGAVEAVAFDRAGRYLATGSADKTVRLWQRDGESFRELLTLSFPDAVAALRFHPDGTQLAVVVQNERAIRIWHLDRLSDSLKSMDLGW